MMRFFGQEAMLWKWRHQIAQYTNREGGVIVKYDDECFFDVELTNSEIDIVLEVWKKRWYRFCTYKVFSS